MIKNPEETAPLESHLDVFRTALIKILTTIALGTAVTFYFHEKIFYFLTANYSSSKLICLTPLDGISSLFKLSLWVGIGGTSFIWIFFLIEFLLPALYSHEKKFIFPLFLTSFLSTLSGVYFAKVVTLPFANDTLASFNQTFAENHWSLTLYLDYVITLFLANVIAFNLICIFFALIYLNVLGKAFLVSARKYAYLIIFIMSAILTPPDIFTQLLLATPLCFLYELGVIVSRGYRQDHCDRDRQ